MNETIKDFIYEDNMEDRKLKAFVEDSMPDGINLARISNLTYNKIHRQKRQRRMAWMSMAAVAVVLLAMSVFIQMQKETAQKAELAVHEAVEEMMSIKVAVGDKMTIMLSDGTRIVANSRSEVRYPKVFSGKTREVYAKGEVYFDVAHDKNNPFIVNVDGLKIKVLGTRFCVNHYSAGKTEVVLVEGCVSAHSSNNDAVTMHPNQLLRLKNGAFESLQEVDTDDYTSWMDGVLNLHGDDLKTVIERVNDYYGTNYKVDERKSDSKLYGRLLYQKDVNEVIKSIEQIAN